MKNWLQNSKLVKYAEEERFRMPERNWLRHWAISHFIANSVFAGSRGLQPENLCAHTQTTPLIKALPHFSKLSTSHLESSSYPNFLPRRTTRNETSSYFASIHKRLLSSYLITFLHDKPKVYIIVQEACPGQQIAVKWVIWQTVGEFEPVTFTSKLHDLIRLTAPTNLTNSVWSSAFSKDWTQFKPSTLRFISNLVTKFCHHNFPTVRWACCSNTKNSSYIGSQRPRVESVVQWWSHYCCVCSTLIDNRMLRWRHGFFKFVNFIQAYCMGRDIGWYVTNQINKSVHLTQLFTCKNWFRLWANPV